MKTKANVKLVTDLRLSIWDSWKWFSLKNQNNFLPQSSKNWPFCADWSGHLESQVARVVSKSRECNNRENVDYLPKYISAYNRSRETLSEINASLLWNVEYFVTCGSGGKFCMLFWPVEIRLLKYAFLWQNAWVLVNPFDYINSCWRFIKKQELSVLSRKIVELS